MDYKMKRFLQNTTLAASLALIIATPALAQNAGDVSLETRVRKVESEVSALQRVVFPGGDARFFPQIQPAQGAPAPRHAATRSAASSTPHSTSAVPRPIGSPRSQCTTISRSYATN